MPSRTLSIALVTYRSAGDKPSDTIRRVSWYSSPTFIGVYTTLFESLTTYTYFPSWSVEIAASYISIALGTRAYGNITVAYMPGRNSPLGLSTDRRRSIVPVALFTAGAS